jgi:DNA topoisomerase-1
MEFRTWKATTFVLEYLQSHDQRGLTDKERKRIAVEAIKSAAEALGNTATICRKYYIHPRIIDLFQSSQLAECRGRGKSVRGLNATEQALLEILRNSP